MNALKLVEKGLAAHDFFCQAGIVVAIALKK